MAEGRPNPPDPAEESVAGPSVERQSFAFGLFLDMSETHANALATVSENQYAIPAKQETIRAIGTQIITGAVVIVVVWRLLDALMIALAAPNGNGPVAAIVATIGVAVGVLAAPTIIKQFFSNS